MSSVNKVILVGRLAADPKQHQTTNGGGVHGEAIARGHALLGMFDIAELTPDTAGRNRRSFRTTPGWVDHRRAVYEKAEDGEFRLLGDPGQLHLKEGRGQAL